MESEKRNRANRLNALKSTGPKSAKGIALSSRNSLKHGLLSRSIILPDENLKDLELLRGGLESYFQPKGELEYELLDRIVFIFWRLRRLGRIEAGILSKNMFLERANHADARASRYEHEKLHDLVEIFSQPIKTITDQAQHDQARAEASGAREQAYSEETVIGGTISPDGACQDALGKLSRYETSIERSLYRSLHELERIQAARTGKPFTLLP